MKTLLCALLLGLFSLHNPPTQAEQLSGFMRDAVDQKLTNAELTDKYFCTSILHQADEKGEEARKTLDYILTLQRQELRKRRLNSNKLTFTLFDKLPVNERSAKPFNILGGTENVYVAQYRGKIVYYFLLQNKKIASNILINKG